MKYGNILTLDSCDSTNSFLKRKIAEKENGIFAVASHRQTFGRGRTGKSFFSEKGIYISFYFETDITDKILLITPMCAVAVCRAIEENADVECKIKWVNDIFIGKRKVCGILCEKTEKGVIIGIGINLRQERCDFPDDISSVATSLFIETGKKCGFEEIKESIKCRIEDMLCSFPDDSEYRDEYIKRSIVLGRKIYFTESGEKKCGKVTEILPDYSLKTEVFGKEVILHSSEISLGSENFTE